MNENGIYTAILGAFSYSRKAPLSFVMSARLFFRLYQRRPHWTDFCEVSYWKLSRKPLDEIQICLKSGK
jgi:hypothetical protein